ncbi:thioredoxin PDI [Cryptosporidium sp. chipmunk genotype I]|uniref:thioredoxin PDI n=1 Tax=Cryptosporidium sp. chipmunk genotype I TaxID=1280935 RepID=UPI00351A8D70|nr:thioredoxin PDI [Cryptosporidium sp. chipmunk genotype I]
MNVFSAFTIPVLLACWSICIILSIMDLYYLNNIDKNWSIYDHQLLESKAWWICGIPLSVYSLLAEISLLIATSFSYMKAQNEIEFEDGERFKEFRSYNSNYTYSNLYENSESYTSSILNWIDSIGIWNRIVFMMTNFIAIMTCYFLFVGLFEYKTRSVTFLLKSSLIGLALILTWVPGVLSTYTESFRLFGIVVTGSIVFIFMMYSRNYQVTGNVKDLTSKVMNIRKLTKGEEIINRRIIERYVESGGKYYTISTSPAAIATELKWGKAAVQVLKDNNSYFDCNFDQNRNSWTNCIEEEITSYPTWLIGDKTISGVVSPKTIAHMVNINLKELSEEVLGLVHPDDKEEIENRISDFSGDSNTETGADADLDSTEGQGEDISKELSSVSFGEGKVDLIAKEFGEGASDNNEVIQEKEGSLERTNKSEGVQKVDQKKKKKRRNAIKRHKSKNQNKQITKSEEEELAEGMYDQPSFRKMNILNKLEANNKVGSERVVNLIEANPVDNEDQSLNEGLELPSKEEFEKFSDNISRRNEEIIREKKKLEQEAEKEIRDIENDDTDQVVGAEAESEIIQDLNEGDSEGREDEFKNKIRRSKSGGLISLGQGEQGGELGTQEKYQSLKSINIAGKNTLEQVTESPEQSNSSDHVVSEMIQSDEVNE